MSERVFTRSQLHTYVGERGYPKYVAFRGVVYDVTNCPKWRRAMHENLHWPGQELPAEIDDAPHTAGVFDHPCVRRVGILEQ